MPSVEVIPAFRALGIALVLGLLVGFQRQRSQSLVAGVRTFSLVTLLGACCALLATAASGPTGDGSATRVAAAVGSGAWILAAGALAIVALAVLGNIIAMKKGHADSGMSTEVAMLVMYAVGALAWLAPMEIPAGIGVGVAILLHAKDALHRFTATVGEKDVRAVLTFALITFIILPVVPNRTYGPFSVLNPHEAWRMVVLVVGISLAGYIATKIVGRSGGAILAGVMGGLVSSTATTASAARQSRPAMTGQGEGSDSRTAHRMDNLAATIVMLATVVMYARVLTEIAVVAPSHFGAIAPPIAIVGAVTLVLGGVVWVRASRDPATIPEPENPTQLRPAIVFGLLYAGVLFVSAAGQHYLGSSGLYVVATISGLTDMDAITLSSARLVQDGRLGAGEASRAVLIAATANMVFKTGMIASLGSRGLLRRICALYAICGASALGLALLWPSGGV